MGAITPFRPTMNSLGAVAQPRDLTCATARRRAVGEQIVCGVQALSGLARQRSRRSSGPNASATFPCALAWASITEPGCIPKFTIACACRTSSHTTWFSIRADKLAVCSVSSPKPQHFLARDGNHIEAFPQALAENEQLDSGGVAHRLRLLMHEAVPHQSLQMAIDRRLRRGEFARELGNADGLSRSCESFQQAQRQIDGLGCRTFVSQLPWRLSKSYEFGHGVSYNETMFHYIRSRTPVVNGLGTVSFC